MRKDYCDRCGTEIDFEALDKYLNSNKCFYDFRISAWSHSIHGRHINSPVELCVDCMMKLDDVSAKFMKEKSCSN